MVGERKEEAAHCVTSMLIIEVAWLFSRLGKQPVLRQLRADLSD